MRRKQRPPAPDLRADWQKEQGARCGCKGTDDMCPCQNQSPWPPEHVVWKARASAAEAERDEARARAKEAEHILLSIDEHEGLVARVLLDREHSRALAAEATVASQAVRIAELEKALKTLIAYDDADPAGGLQDHPGFGSEGSFQTRALSDDLERARTTLAAQPQDQGEGE